MNTHTVAHLRGRLSGEKRERVRQKEGEREGGRERGTIEGERKTEFHCWFGNMNICLYVPIEPIDNELTDNISGLLHTARSSLLSDTLSHPELKYLHLVITWHLNDLNNLNEP